ncbi:MAG: aldo/keto reductase [Oceanospirillaceae bacterium]|nr:aldo/keto reductase [Oceanospirillaceae bacterium]
MHQKLQQQHLGKKGPLISPMGIGTWAIGGPFYAGAGLGFDQGAALGWGQVKDRESIDCLRFALDAGVNFFDTADLYGAGHSEVVVGRAFKGIREQVLIASKFGNTFDANLKTMTGTDISPSYIIKACEDSLKRLQTDWIDLYQVHLEDIDTEQIPLVTEALEVLCEAGKIRCYGWSTNNIEGNALFCKSDQATALQFDMNVLHRADHMLSCCELNNCTAIIRQPLAMGLLSGKYVTSKVLSNSDIRKDPPPWLTYFDKNGADKTHLKRLAAIKEILTSNGRTITQGALAWIWAKHPNCVPIPGVRTVAQVKENIAAMDYGALTQAQLTEIDQLLELV